MKVEHHPACGCGRCRIDRMMLLDAARREEIAGREDVALKRRPDFWRPRPGTIKAIDRSYPTKEKRHAS